MLYTRMTWIIVLLGLGVSCTPSNQEPVARERDATGATANSGTSGELSWDEEASNDLVLSKNMTFDSTLLSLSTGDAEAVYSFDPDTSTCDEHPWSETFAVNQDGTLVGHPTQEGICTIGLIATKDSSQITSVITLKITGCSSHTQTITLTNDSDDGYYYGPMMFETNGSGQLYLGSWSDSNGLMHSQRAFWRFPLTQAIPKGAKITSTVLNVHGRDAYSGFSYGFEVGMLQSDDSAEPSLDNSPLARGRLPTVQSWVDWDLLASYDHTDWNATPNLFSLMQKNLNGTTSGLGVGAHVTVMARPELAYGSADGELAFEDSNYSTNDPTLQISWNECVDANDAPVFGFVSPAGSERLAPSDDLAISWTDNDPDSDAKIDLYLVADGDSGSCTGGANISLQISEDDLSDAFTYSIPAATASGLYRVCALVNDGQNNTVEVISSEFAIARICEWDGSTDTDWDTADNWSSCNSVVPNKVDDVFIPVTGNAPTITTTTIVHNIAGGVGGGEITVATGGGRLVIDGARIQSSVALKGTASCTDCFVDVADELIVNNSATLTLNTNIIVNLTGRKKLLIGDGTTAGHLVTNGTATGADWPELTYMRVHNAWWGVAIEGTVSEKSTVDVDGLKIHSVEWWKNHLDFIDYFDILGLDNIAFSGNSFKKGGSYIELDKCDDTADITDTTWSGLIMYDVVAGGSNIDANGCENETVTISGDETQPGYGSSADWDSHSILTWTNSSHFTCTFNKVSGEWRDATNWDGCANSRNGWPDLQDYVTVPAGRTVTIDNGHSYPHMSVGRLLGGGGKIEFDEGVYLIIGGDWNGQIRGDITIGSTSGVTCADCGLLARGDMEIKNNATLTLEDGARLLADGDNLLVGNGDEAGHLVTNSISATEANWPEITAYATWTQFDGIIVEGISGSTHSSVSLNRFKISRLTNENIAVDFVDEYTVTQFDDVIMDYMWGTAQFMRLRGCSNSTFSDTTWSEIDFHYSANNGYNIDACADAPTITMGSKSGGDNSGYGATFETDPGNNIDWP